MDTRFDPAVRDRNVARIESLRPNSPRGWGRMDVAQEMSHCPLAPEAATGDAVLPSNFAAKLIGPLFKGWIVGPKPFSKDSPTHPLLVLDKAPCDFDRHAFVQKLTGDEWGRLQFKHLDHHLRQFGA